MRIAEQTKSCRFWGYAPASDEHRHAVGKHGLEKTWEYREQYKTECKVVRTAGYKPVEYGLSKEDAVAKAKALESRFSDIEFWVFSHDYM